MKQSTIITTLLLPFLALAHGKDKMDGADEPTAPADGAGKGGRGHVRKQGPCDQFIHAEMVIKINQNETEMARIQAKNPNRAQRLQAENANATSFVHQMETNTTFVTECQQVEAHRQFEHQCARMRHLQLESASTANATRAEAAKTKLAQMQSNQTLVTACKSDGAKGGKAGGAGAAAATAEAAKATKNGAGSIQAYGGGIFALGISVFMATFAL